MAAEQDAVGELVRAAHGDATKVRQLLEASPALVNERYATFDETALEAASHMGRREIAEQLLAAGAPLTMCAAAMLGRCDDVAALLERDPSLANARGAHGIPLMFHAALSGDTDIADLLLAHGAGEGMDVAIHAAVTNGHAGMVEWLISHGAGVNAGNFEGKTPLSVALERGHTEIADLLRRHGGRD